MPRLRLLAAVCLAGTTFLSGSASSGHPPDWSREVADPGGRGVFHSSLVAKGASPHVSYQDDTRGVLKYAGGGIGDWEFVDESEDVGGYSSLALDASEVPHISYYDATHRRLKYAVKAGDVWRREVADAGGVGMFTSLALTSSHGTVMPCISYFDYTNGRLKYACRDLAGSWAPHVVDATAGVGLYTSLAIDAGGRPHISYYDATNGDLRYATHDAAGWRIETVDSSGNVGLHTSLELDADGHPHIAYHDATNRHLKYARGNGRAWTVETVDAVDGTGQHASLALDGAGLAHIAYYDQIRGDLKYARQDETRAWIAYTLPSGESAGGGDDDVGAYASLSLNDSGFLVTYSNRTYGSLRLYTGDATSGVTQLLDEFDEAGMENSSARDSLDRPHVAYLWRRRLFDAAEPFDVDLTYAFKSGTSWISAVIDADGAEQVSLGVDGSDGVHVAYRRDGALWYAKKGAAGWSRELVDPGPDVATPSLRVKGVVPFVAYDKGGEVKLAMRWAAGWGAPETVGPGHSPSLAVGPGGLPHVSFVRSERLRYARKGAWPDCNPPSGCWVEEVVDQESSVGGRTSIALTAAGVPHISYHRTFPGDDSGDLRYATKVGAAWSLETVHGAGPLAGASYGGESSIALDAAGAPRFAYSESAAGRKKIRLARRTPEGGFSSDVADESVPVIPGLSAVRHPSLTITAAGASCVSYLDDRNGSVLKYACHP